MKVNNQRLRPGAKLSTVTAAPQPAAASAGSFTLLPPAEAVQATAEYDSRRYEHPPHASAEEQHSGESDVCTAPQPYQLKKQRLNPGADRLSASQEQQEYASPRRGQLIDILV
jgi:hypothetical protein